MRFFGPNPALMVVEPESLYWITGRMAGTRDGITWAGEFARLPALRAVVRDDGTGLGKGVRLDNARRRDAGLAGFDQTLDQSGDIAVRDHHALRDIRQRHAFRHLVELGHQVETRQGNVEPLPQAAADLALDQGRARQKPQPEPKLAAVISGKLDGLGLGIKDHVAIIPASNRNGAKTILRTIF